MPFFKDTGGGLHFLEDSSFEHLLPLGCIKITDSEASEVYAPQKTSYQALRAAEYPLITDFIDGMVKMHSENPLMQLQGQEQISNYYSSCLGVKERIPKENI